jgi:hypothetical protein
MSAPNGHAQKDHIPASGPPPLKAGVLQVQAKRVKELVAALEVPFDQSQIDWRVMNTTKGQQPARGQAVPYADQRAYTDRLNALFTPAGWTRKYTIHTSANFERSKDQKIVAKVLVACELTIFGLGSHRYRPSPKQEQALLKDCASAAVAALSSSAHSSPVAECGASDQGVSLVREIEQMEQVLGNACIAGC